MSGLWLIRKALRFYNSSLKAILRPRLYPSLLLLAVIGSAFGVLRRAARIDGAQSTWPGAPPQLAQALQASLVGFVVGAFFLSLAYSEMLYSLVAFAVALRKVVPLPTRPDRWAVGRAA